MFIFFNLLYWSTALGGSWLLRYFSKNGAISPLNNHHLYPGQVKTEIGRSLVSIAVFSLQGIILQQGIKAGWLQSSYSVTWRIIPEILVLFIWNEIHFYLVHRLLHLPWMIRRIHWVHHHSKEPTVFSTFSFHWVEAFLLGTVILFPLLVYPFEWPALLSLPVMSILLNTLGHCNYDLFPKSSLHSILKFSNRHSLHHQMGKGNFGFMLPWFDTAFKTAVPTKSPNT